MHRGKMLMGATEHLLEALDARVCLPHAFLTPPASLPAPISRFTQNLGEIPDTDRPLLTYTPQQLGALLESQGVEVRRAGSYMLKTAAETCTASLVCCRLQLFASRHAPVGAIPQPSSDGRASLSLLLPGRQGWQAAAPLWTRAPHRLHRLRRCLMKCPTARSPARPSLACSPRASWSAA